MRSIVYKNSFKKEFALIERRGKDSKKLAAVIALLQQDLPLLEKHRDHALTGNWSGYRDCHIEPDWLLIYKKGKDANGADILYLEATGSHADLF
jgi:mRNA interferase YafQ